MACRRYRNRRIGEFLKELSLTEGRNTGIHKILRALRQNGSPDPLFETDKERLHFMVTLYERPQGGKQAEGRAASSNGQREER
jgi:ATP-dependent DNA helicase RecG